jgi:hypothetical protein
MTAIRLYPPLFEEGKSNEFLRSGRTLSVAQSPRDNSLAVFTTNAVRRTLRLVSIHHLTVV